MNELEQVQQLGDDALIERLIHSVRSDRQLSVRLLIVKRDCAFASPSSVARFRLRSSCSGAVRSTCPRFRC